MSVLERSVVAMRVALAETPDPDESRLRRSLLEYGVRVRRVERDKKGELRRLEISNADSRGWIEILESSKRRFVHAWFEAPSRRVELRARIVEAAES